MVSVPNDSWPAETGAAEMSRLATNTTTRPMPHILVSFFIDLNFSS